MHQLLPGAGFTKNQRMRAVLVAVFVVGLLLGGYFWMMNMEPSQPDQASTPTASVSGPENVYMARDNHVVKLDGRTGAILWQHNLAPSEVNFPQSPQTCIQIVDGVMYAVLDYDSYAFQTSDGQELWHMSMPHTQPSNLSCQAADGRIYVLHTDGTFSALDTKDGMQLWRSAVVQTNSLLFQVQHRVIYSEQNVGLAPRLTALDGATGKERWHADLQEGNTLFPTRVADGLVYHGTGNSLYALSETTSHIIWQQHTDNASTFFTEPYLANGVLYVETSANIAVAGNGTSQSESGSDIHRLYAFDAKKGTLLWKSGPGFLFADNASLLGEGSLPLAGDMIIAYQDHSTFRTLSALDARSGTSRWQVQIDQNCAGGLCGSFRIAFDKGKIILLESASSSRLLTLELSSGRTLAQQPLQLILLPGGGIAPAGIDNERAYALVGGNGAPAMIHAFSLVNGVDLWHYQVGPYASGSIGMPIIAP